MNQQKLGEYIQKSCAKAARQWWPLFFGMGFIAGVSITFLLLEVF